MKKPAFIYSLHVIMCAAILFLAGSVEGADGNQTGKNIFRYDPRMHDDSPPEEPSLYFSGHGRTDGKEPLDDSVRTTVSSEDAVLSSISIRNSPEKLVNSVAHSFSLRDRGPRPSFTVEVPSTPADILMIGAAFLTNLAVHEIGHEVVARHVGATGSRLDFFETRNGQFFLGTSSVEDIESDAVLPYTMGGEFFVDLTFEHALREYRKKPTVYNQALLLSSGIDFAFYCFYAFYAGEDHPEFDPVTISRETGLSRDHLFSIVMAKTMINAYRVYSGEDRVIPYFTVDTHSAMLNLGIPFEIPSCIFGGCGPPEEEM